MYKRIWKTDDPEAWELVVYTVPTWYWRPRMIWDADLKGVGWLGFCIEWKQEIRTNAICC